MGTDLAIALDKNTAVPLHRQLYQELRRGILTGRLLPNQRLPSTRTLAESLGISRSTVTLAYEQLLSEGYLETTVGSGTFVCSQLPDDLLKLQPLEDSDHIQNVSIELSTYGTQLKTVEPRIPELDLPINFRYGRPALDQFPAKLWRKLYARHCGSNLTLLDYSPDRLGYQPLRVAIAHYLGSARAVQCEPEQIIITNGYQQALDLVTRLLVNPSDTVAIENPGYLGARQVFEMQGAKLLPIAVDESGVVVEDLFAASVIKLVYVTPSHQFPTGAVLSLPRRLELLTWAQQTGTAIVEDDYDSEYRYSSRPIPALQGLDRHGLVFYIGTFSKILFPSLRIGYLVAPKPLVSVFARAKWLCDRQSPLLEQQVLADFINEGHLESHLRRMRRLYDQRRQALVTAIRDHLGQATILGENAGIHLLVKLSISVSDEVVVQKAAQAGVGLVTARLYYLQGNSKGEFLFGYSELDEQQIQEGIRRLAQVLEKC